LTVYALYVRGWDRIDQRQKTPLPNEHEIDVTFSGDPPGRR